MSPISQSVKSDSTCSSVEFEAILMCNKVQPLHEQPSCDKAAEEECSQTTSRTLSSCTSTTDSSKRVRFAPSHSNLVVPPISPLTPTEKRAVWYTSKELQVIFQKDIDQYTQYLTKRAKRHSFASLLSLEKEPHEESPRRWSAPEGRDPNNTCWRGLEHHKATAEKNTGRTRKAQPTRQETIQDVVVLHRKLSFETLRKNYQKRSRADRLRAERLGLEDATDALGKKEVLKHCFKADKHSTPDRRLRKVSMLAQIGVKSALVAVPSL